MCICKNCGKNFDNPDTKKFPKDFCSYGCYEKWRKWNEIPNCKCVICNKEMFLKPYRLKRVKNGVTCSKECTNKLKEKYMSGNKNHQYRLIGDKNSSFIEKDLISNYGYILEYAPGHPFPHDKSIKGTRVLQHRLVIERNFKKFDSKFFIKINECYYLRQEYIVHHINGIKTDNRLENLQILTKGEHSTIHNKDKEIIRDSKGRIVGVVKLGNIGKNPEKENTEINSEISKGSESSYSTGSE